MLVIVCYGENGDQNCTRSHFIPVRKAIIIKKGTKKLLVRIFGKRNGTFIHCCW